MTRKLKRPDGWLLQEYTTLSGHLFENGTLARYGDGSVIADHTAADGVYTGRFGFQFATGDITPMYTESSAPKWLLALYNEVIR